MSLHLVGKIDHFNGRFYVDWIEELPNNQIKISTQGFDSFSEAERFRKILIREFKPEIIY